MTGKGKTIKDIAEMAGVSKATVSRVMNNSGYVAAETRTKIENLMKEYDYMPKSLADFGKERNCKSISQVASYPLS